MQVDELQELGKAMACDVEGRGSEQIEEAISWVEQIEAPMFGNLARGIVLRESSHYLLKEKFKSCAWDSERLDGATTLPRALLTRTPYIDLFREEVELAFPASCRPR